MIDSFDITSLQYRPEEIRREADSFRQTHWPDDTIPVDIELIVERMGLDLEPIAGIKKDSGITASLCPDLKTVCIDLETMRDPRQAVYLRFSLAHEIGHWVLHRGFFEWQKEQGLSTVRDWIAFVRRCSGHILAQRFEQDANEFAGRLLVPVSHLRRALDEVLTPEVQKEISGYPGEVVRDFLAGPIHRRFLVSSPVISIRLRVEDLYP